ncbi:ankyrin repeat domain-containing protein 17-like [Canna indica]|uniref:Ankyrin repeat domain-containing protein 17-like n=1 Tax=Canna indica TaxID=4628 RepID=A0AAQ3K2N7_9LILI|nr:ankyrin repeat domain-containing protein 17-like [Canna indica]
MTVFAHSMSVGGAGGVVAVAVKAAAGGRQQVHPVTDYAAAEASQRLVEAAQCGDSRAIAECLADPAVDVNYAGAVCLRGRRAVVVLREEATDEVIEEHEELRTDASALFLAAHAGDLALVRKLLEKGADVNQKLFRGYAITAAVREGQSEVVEALLKAGASQPACEEAVVEASLHGRARLAELLMGSDLVRPRVAARALVLAASRGFTDVVDTLIKCGADANATSRLLLRSMKPALHTDVDCTALIAAIVSRQVSVVRRLLQAGVRKDAKVRLGAWSWDSATGEEFRVGAGLAEPYSAAWCAVEYFESSGAILRLVLQHYSPNALHHGRTLLHHAILCANLRAVDTLLACGADFELPVKTGRKVEFQPIHLAARLGLAPILQSLIDKGCDLNSRTEIGETALMLCARYKRDNCLRVLVSAGADLSLVSSAGVSAAKAAASSHWSINFQRAVLDVIRSRTIPRSSNPYVFSPVMFAAQCGDVGSVEALLTRPDIDIDAQDENGCSPVMAAAKEGHVNVFRVLVFAGANVKLCNKAGETAIDLSRSNENRDLFEQVMLDFTLEKGNAGGFYALHFAARRGDMAAVRLLTRRGCDVNSMDGEGYTSLMLAAREGHGEVCELLILSGAKCDLKTHRGETALSLARANTKLGMEAENAILDELARLQVLQGGHVKKHTKSGKGSPHEKVLGMVAAAGVLRWGKGSRRNVVCVEAEVGASSAFQRNRRGKGDAYEPGLFRVVTARKREVHFVCSGGEEAAKLWVRGIRLVTRGTLGKGGNVVASS